MTRKKASYWNSTAAMQAKAEFANKTSAELLEMQRAAKSIHVHAYIQAELTRRRSQAAREERERRRGQHMTTGQKHGAIVRAEAADRRAEAQSYGVRCNGCGEWETACRCDA